MLSYTGEAVLSTKTVKRLSLGIETYSPRPTNICSFFENLLKPVNVLIEYLRKTCANRKVAVAQLLLELDSKRKAPSPGIQGWGVKRVR